MRRRLVALVGLLTLAAAALAAAAPKGPGDQEVLPDTASVVICHAAGNSFTRNEVNVDSIVNKAGHGGHPNDIIPPFRYQLSPTEAVRDYPGRNWDEQGEAIWTNGCSRPRPPSGTIEVFACVDVHGSSFDATFGYHSNAGPVEIAAGPSNGFSPAPVDRGQVTKFSDGYVPAAFAVKNVAEPELTWTVKHDGHTASVTVSRSSPPCTVPPEPPSPEPTVPIGVFVTCVTNHGSSYDAVFGYESENLDPHTIPVGSANHFSPAPGDRGQPTTFRPGQVKEAVTVTGIPDSVALRWTLALTDTRTATATADFDVKCDQPEPAPRPFGVFATCATRHGSTYDATFGYANEDDHSLKVPIGAHNFVSPGPADQGQPETFAPGFVDAAFAVRGVPVSQSVTWRLQLDRGERVAVATANLPDCLTAPIGPVSRATVSKSVVPRRALVGQRVRFTIELRNTGSAVLSPAEVKDVLEGARLRILSATATQEGRCRVNGSGGTRTLRCRAPTLAPGASLTIRVAAEAIEVGTARDRAVVVGLPHSNAATAAVRIAAPPSVGLG